MPVWAMWGPATELGVKSLESCLRPLSAAGKRERRTAPLENPTCGIADLSPSHSCQIREIDNPGDAHCDKSQIGLSTVWGDLRSAQKDGGRSVIPWTEERDRLSAITF